MLLDQRTSDILVAAVREFIATGEPVSSSLFFDRHDFGIRPAMIRWTLRGLETAGYLAQPNYSAGRVPTDRGYEFYAARVLDQLTEGIPRRELSEPFTRHAWSDLLHELSRDLGLMSALSPLQGATAWKSGLEELIDRFDWDSKNEIREVIRDVESLDERLLSERHELVGADVNIFIGKKSPVTRCQYLSVVTGTYDADGERIVLCAIGPKRMDYRRAAKTFKNLKHAGKRSSPIDD